MRMELTSDRILKYLLILCLHTNWYARILMFSRNLIMCFCSISWLSPNFVTAHTVFPKNCVSSVVTAIVVLIMNAFFLFPYGVLMAIVTLQYMTLDYAHCYYCYILLCGQSMRTYNNEDRHESGVSTISAYCYETQYCTVHV
jgi:hypothetical protein